MKFAGERWKDFCRSLFGIYGNRQQKITTVEFGTSAILRHKQSEEALRRSEQKYRNIFEKFQVGIARIR